MKEIKIFIPKETKIEIEKIISSDNDRININIPKGLKIDLENSNENEIYIVYKNENLIIYDENLIAINDVTYEFTEDDDVCKNVKYLKIIVAMLIVYQLKEKIKKMVILK